MSEAEAMRRHLDALSVSDMLSSSVFWVFFTLSAFLVVLALHGYWTNWAHKRLDTMRGEIDDLKRECENVKQEVNDIKQRNPFTLLTKINTK